jgi:diaminopimelate decarboxylase
MTTSGSHWAAAERDIDCLSVRDGVLHIEGVSTLGLARRFGTPLFVFSRSQIRENLRRFHDAFAAGWPGPVDVLPAFKANTILATRRILSAEGAGADIYSPQELEGVLRTGVDPDRVSVNGGGKSREHLRNCVEAGVRITVEDVDEIDLIQEVAAELDAVAKIRFRTSGGVPTSPSSASRSTSASRCTSPVFRPSTCPRWGVGSSTCRTWRWSGSTSMPAATTRACGTGRG